uniref:Uncharacterized protein n=1 Tax=Romanomermis culicivorax TaxID=13658 RepID=A0A915I0H9_ROMCU
MWITFNRSVTKTSFLLSDFKPGILPIRQIHIGEPSGPILAVYSQNNNWRVGVENKNMQKHDNNSKNKVSDAFVLIQSTLCMDCCFIMAVNFTQFSRSSEKNKPANIVNMVWQMGSEPGGDCLDSSPVQIPETRQGKTSTTGKVTMKRATARKKCRAKLIK